MKYEVCPRSTLIHNGVKYPEGAIAPDGIDSASLLSVGAIREIDESTPARPDPIPERRAFTHRGYDPNNPETVSNVPLRLLPALLASVNESEALLALHEADTRKGGRDLIEERLGELETS